MAILGIMGGHTKMVKEMKKMAGFDSFKLLNRIFLAFAIFAILLTPVFADNSHIASR